MIKYHEGNIFTAPVDVILHQANIYHTFGAGIALQIKNIFPEAYEADLETKKGDKSKLGTYSVAEVYNPDYSNISKIFNCYSQVGISSQDRVTKYDLVVQVFEKVRDFLNQTNNLKAGKPFVIGIPFRYGSGLAGGDFSIVEAIIRSVFKDYIGDVLICRRPEDK